MHLNPLLYLNCVMCCTLITGYCKCFVPHFYFLIPSDQ